MKKLAPLAVLLLALVIACGTESGPPPTPATDVAGRMADTTATAGPTEAPEATATPAEPSSIAPTPTSLLAPTAAAEPTVTPTGAEHYTTKDLVTMVSGLGHSCGLRADSTAVCWGEDWYGQSSGPVGSFTAITTFDRNSCGARPQGGIECWANGRLRNRNNWPNPLKPTHPWLLEKATYAP